MQRHLRLRRRVDFEQLRAEGQVVRHPLFVFSYRANDKQHNCYGVIVSRRLGKAVQRNKIRRRLREALRHYEPMIVQDTTQGYDMALIARLPVAQASYGQIHTALGRLLRRTTLLAS